MPRFEDGETLLGRVFSDCVHSAAALEQDIAPAESCVDFPIYFRPYGTLQFYETLFLPAFSSAEKSPGNEIAIITSRTNDRDNDNNHNGNNGDDLDNDVIDNVNDKDDNDNSKNSNDNDNDDNDDDTDNVQDGNNNVKNN